MTSPHQSPCRRCSAARALFIGRGAVGGHMTAWPEGGERHGEAKTEGAARRSEDGLGSCECGQDTAAGEGDRNAGAVVGDSRHAVPARDGSREAAEAQERESGGWYPQQRVRGRVESWCGVGSQCESCKYADFIVDDKFIPPIALCEMGRRSTDGDGTCSDYVPRAETTVVGNSDVQEINDIVSQCDGRAALVVIPVGEGIASGRRATAYQTVGVVCGVAVEGHCTHSCPLHWASRAQWTALRELLQKDGVQPQLAAVVGPKRIVVPSPRDRESVRVRHSKGGGG